MTANQLRYTFTTKNTNAGWMAICKASEVVGVGKTKTISTEKLGPFESRKESQEAGRKWVDHKVMVIL